MHLLRRRAFAEGERHLPVDDLPIEEFSSLGEITEAGLATVRQDDGGALFVGLKLSSISVFNLERVTEPYPFVTASPRDVAPKTMAKLELVQSLIQSGWALADDCGKFFLPDSALALPAECLDMPKNYLACLVSCRSLWDKGLATIWHQGPNDYYTCLLKFEDIRPIADVPDEVLQFVEHGSC